jgi:hypothetical protein
LAFRGLDVFNLLVVEELTSEILILVGFGGLVVDKFMDGMMDRYGAILMLMLAIGVSDGNEWHMGIGKGWWSLVGGGVNKQ